MTSHAILIVDDERALVEEVADFFCEQGYECAIALSAEEALRLAEEKDFSVILTDIRMPGMDGIELTTRLREISPESQVLLMTAHPSVETAVSAMRLGASDYVLKPLVLEDLLLKVRRMLEFRSQQLELRWRRQHVQTKYDYSNIVGESQGMKEVYRLIERVAVASSPVLIASESGTGKELVARAIHYNGPRKDARFLAINCAAIPAPLLEAQLFGHVKGAFTGADSASEGMFRAAAQGTLFLDEIGDMPIELQPKLLRAIENQEILPLGEVEPFKTDARIVASTNKDLQDAVRAGRFREDLFYRLSVVTINIPPLRERREDIPALVDFFIRRFNVKLGRKVTGVTNETLRQLLRSEWKGNVRELQNFIERAMILEDNDLITPSALPSASIDSGSASLSLLPLKEAARDFERGYIETVLRVTDGDKTLAADMLGVSVSLLYRRLQGMSEEPAETADAAP